MVVEDGTAGAIGAAAGAAAAVGLGVVTGDGVTVAADVAWAIGCGLSFLVNNNMIPTPANVTNAPTPNAKIQVLESF